MVTKVKITRIKKGIKQKDLAFRIGITQTYLADLENGKAKNPSKGIMDKIASALNSSVQELFYEGDEENVKN